MRPITRGLGAVGATRSALTLLVYVVTSARALCLARKADLTIGLSQGEGAWLELLLGDQPALDPHGRSMFTAGAISTASSISSESSMPAEGERYLLIADFLLPQRISPFEHTACGGDNADNNDVHDRCYQENLKIGK